MEDKILLRIKEVLIKDDWLKSVYLESGDVWVKRHGALTLQVYKGLGISRSKALYWLNKMEKKGLLHKHPTPGGNTSWYPIGWNWEL